MRAFWRRKVLLPAMLGPVTSQMRPALPAAPSLSFAPSFGVLAASSRRQPLATKLPCWAAASAASTTGWRPAAMSNAVDSSSCGRHQQLDERSEEHTSELQSLMRISYAVFCLKKKKKHHGRHNK